jgi:hypothetical protein
MQRMNVIGVRLCLTNCRTSLAKMDDGWDTSIRRSDGWASGGAGCCSGRDSSCRWIVSLLPTATLGVSLVLPLGGGGFTMVDDDWKEMMWIITKQNIVNGIWGWCGGEALLEADNKFCQENDLPWKFRKWC